MTVHFKASELVGKPLRLRPRLLHFLQKNRLQWLGATWELEVET